MQNRAFVSPQSKWRIVRFAHTISNTQCWPIWISQSEWQCVIHSRCQSKCFFVSLACVQFPNKYLILSAFATFARMNANVVNGFDINTAYSRVWFKPYDLESLCKPYPLGFSVIFLAFYWYFQGDPLGFFLLLENFTNIWSKPSVRFEQDFSVIGPISSRHLST